MTSSSSFQYYCQRRPLAKRQAVHCISAGKCVSASVLARLGLAKEKEPAILVLEDGSIFEGTSIGHLGLSVGEVVFNTSMTGYQEILSDPSYAEQIVTLTYPHIGNTGATSEDDEHAKVWAKGLVIRDLPRLESNFRADESLESYLKNNNVVGIADIDTRRLTRVLRDKGAQKGCIMAGEVNLAKAQEAVASFSGLKGLDLAKVVSTQERYEWTQGTWRLDKESTQEKPSQRFKVVALDFGIKANILRMLTDRGCDVTVVPAQTSVEEILALKPDGVFLSNGPGDPEPCVYAVDAIKHLLDKRVPMFGICLGHQLLGLASGAATQKMKFGHHGANHPVQNTENNQVMITSQNHGFAIDEDSLPANVNVTHRSLFDGTVQGISLKDKPAFGFQGHPEASPGPHDGAELFDQFIHSMQSR